MHSELFDRPVNRRGTDCLKYDFALERGKPEGVLPLWVADMDFPAPACVLDKLHAAVSHGIFGYSDTKSDYTALVRAWFASHYGWSPEDSWLVKTPGVVFALAAAVRRRGPGTGAAAAGDRGTGRKDRRQGLYRHAARQRGHVPRRLAQRGGRDEDV